LNRHIFYQNMISHHGIGKNIIKLYKKMNNTIKKIIIIGFSIIYALTLTPALAFAKSSHKSHDSEDNSIVVSINSLGAIHLKGTVSSISGSTLLVSSWGGTWSVDSSKAKITPSIGETSNLSLIKTGDVVTVSGTASKTGLSVIATMIHDNFINEKDEDKDNIKKKSNFKGIISNLNASAGTFTLLTEKLGDLTVTTSSSNVEVFKFPHILSSFDSLVNGMRVFVSGMFDSVTKTITATLIRVRK